MMGGRGGYIDESGGWFSSVREMGYYEYHCVTSKIEYPVRAMTIH
jgi:hypothetical protein